MGIWDKLLQDRGLAALDPSPLAPAREAESETPTTPLNTTASALSSRLDTAVKQTAHHRLLASELAWRCSYCDTINTLIADRPLARKTCSKCKKNRIRVQTVRDEIQELKILEDLKAEENKLTGTAFDKVTEDLL